MSIARSESPTKSPLIIKTSEPVPPDRYQGVLKEIIVHAERVDDQGNHWEPRLQFVFLLNSGLEASKYTGMKVSQKSGLRAFLKMLTLPGEVSEKLEKDSDLLWNFINSLVGRQYWIDVDWNEKRTWTYVVTTILIVNDRVAA
jgi:hypothetical protein